MTIGCCGTVGGGTPTPPEFIVDCGSYTPTYHNEVNANTITVNSHLWSRVGCVVTVSGTITLTNPADAPVSLEIGLPVGSNFVSTEDAVGGVRASWVNSNPNDCFVKEGRISAEVTTDRAKIDYIPNNFINAHTIVYTFQYEILP